MNREPLKFTKCECCINYAKMKDEKTGKTKWQCVYNKRHSGVQCVFNEDNSYYGGTKREIIRYWLNANNGVEIKGE